jgi:hypothetical protein
LFGRFNSFKVLDPCRVSQRALPVSLLAFHNNNSNFHLFTTNFSDHFVRIITLTVVKMPPKKAATKAKATPAKAAATSDPPPTVTSSKGKVYETSAAAGRPRRATAAPESPVPVKKAAAKKGTATVAKKAAPKTAAKAATRELTHLSYISFKLTGASSDDERQEAWASSQGRRR